MKPAFSYYGGKQTMAPKIIPLIPDHTLYVEPFCGGAGLFFKKQVIKDNNYQEVINDINSNVINFFKELRDNPQPLMDKLAFSPYSFEDYQQAKKIYFDPNPYNEFERAWAFFVSCEQAFANKIGGGWGISRMMTNQVSQWRNKIDNLFVCVDRLKLAYIENNDVLKCIKKWDSPQTLFYLDPPYPGTNCGHYSGYTQENFDELLSALKNCQASFLLSCYPNDAVPKKWEKFEFAKQCTVNMKSKNKERVEVVWRVDRSKNIEKTILKHAKEFGKILRGE